MAKGSDEIQAFLGKGTEFQGQIKFEGTVRIDGVFRGEIHTPGTLVIGEGAKIEAEVNCGTLLVSGEIVGNVQAGQRVEALAPAKLIGNIQTPVLVINEGVLFDGNARMDMGEENRSEREKKIRFLGKREKRTQPDEVADAEGQEAET